MISSLGCTVQLQINNTRKAWRISVGPLRAVLKDLLVRTLHGQGLGPTPQGPGMICDPGLSFPMGHHWHFLQDSP